MKIPKYIEANNKLLVQADKHSMIVLEWYNRQLEKLNAGSSEVSDEEFSEIQNNWLANGEISISAIKENLELMEQKYAQ